MNAVEGFSQIERHCPKRVLQATGHLHRKTAVPLAHLGRWMPIGPLLLATDRLGPRPVEAVASNGDAADGNTDNTQAIILPNTGKSRASNAVTGDTPEALASAILHVARA